MSMRCAPTAIGPVSMPTSIAAAWTTYLLPTEIILMRPTSDHRKHLTSISLKNQSKKTSAKTKAHKQKDNKMNAYKIQISEQPMPVRNLPTAQKISAVQRPSVFSRFITSIKTHMNARRRSDLNLEQWRRLEFRNEWRESPRDHYIKFMF